jgi:hypothetical protein
MTGSEDPAEAQAQARRSSMKVVKTLAVAAGVLLAALVIIPLVILAGLFVWLKLTEESDEEILELEQETV